VSKLRCLGKDIVAHLLLQPALCVLTYLKSVDIVGIAKHVEHTGRCYSFLPSAETSFEGWNDAEVDIEAHFSAQQTTETEPVLLYCHLPYIRHLVLNHYYEEMTR
jgi:hypothetical protein